ncbi:MAG: hypothetical protein KBT11_04220 [Treponema sp.]|nr:hypothetical protein [Candidatus Treponema equifaecale]
MKKFLIPLLSLTALLTFFSCSDLNSSKNGDSSEPKANVVLKFSKGGTGLQNSARLITSMELEEIPETGWTIEFYKIISTMVEDGLEEERVLIQNYIKFGKDSYKYRLEPGDYLVTAENDLGEYKIYGATTFNIEENDSVSPVIPIGYKKSLDGTGTFGPVTVKIPSEFILMEDSEFKAALVTPDGEIAKESEVLTPTEKDTYSEIQINFSEVPSGFYYLRVTDKDSPLLLSESSLVEINDNHIVTRTGENSLSVVAFNGDRNYYATNSASVGNGLDPLYQINLNELLDVIYEDKNWTSADITIFDVPEIDLSKLSGEDERSVFITSYSSTGESKFEIKGENIKCHGPSLAAAFIGGVDADSVKIVDLEFAISSSAICYLQVTDFVEFNINVSPEEGLPSYVYIPVKLVGKNADLAELFEYYKTNPIATVEYASAESEYTIWFDLMNEDGILVPNKVSVDGEKLKEVHNFVPTGMAAVLPQYSFPNFSICYLNSEGELLLDDGEKIKKSQYIGFSDTVKIKLVLSDEYYKEFEFPEGTKFTWTLNGKEIADADLQDNVFSLDLDPLSSLLLNSNSTNYITCTAELTVDETEYKHSDTLMFVNGSGGSGSASQTFYLSTTTPTITWTGSGNSCTPYVKDKKFSVDYTVFDFDMETGDIILFRNYGEDSALYKIFANTDHNTIAKVNFSGGTSLFNEISSGIDCISWNPFAYRLYLVSGTKVYWNSTGYYLLDYTTGTCSSPNKSYDFAVIDDSDSDAKSLFALDSDTTEDDFVLSGITAIRSIDSDTVIIAANALRKVEGVSKTVLRLGVFESYDTGFILKKGSVVELPLNSDSLSNISVTDMLYTDYSIYATVAEVNRSAPDPKSRGAIVKLKFPDSARYAYDSIEIDTTWGTNGVLGWTKEAKTYQGKSISLDIYSPDSVESTNFFGPSKIISLSSSKIEIVDRGIMAIAGDTTAETPASSKNINRKIELTLGDTPEVKITDISDSDYSFSNLDVFSKEGWNY